MAQSKVWFAEESWWGVLLAANGELHIERLDWASMVWADTGVLVDERPNARADCLWDGQHLYIATSPAATNHSQGLRLLRFSYQPSQGRFVLDPDFPLTLTDAGVDDLVVSRDSRGVVWLTYLAAANTSTSTTSTPSPASAGTVATSSSPATGTSSTIWALHTTAPDDLHWTSPYQPVAGAAARQVTQLAAVATGAGLALVWTNSTDDAVYSARHPDGAPDTGWTVDKSPVDGAAGSNLGLSVAVLPDDPARRLFVGLIDALDKRPDANPLWARTLLLVVTPGGGVKDYLFGLLEDHHVQPVLAIDPIHRMLFMFATAPTGGGAVYMKSTSIDDIGFGSGVGQPLVSSASDPDVAAPTVSKQPADLASGILVLASDDGTGRYVEAAMSLGGPAPGVASTSTPTPSTSPVAGLVNTLIDDTFDPWASGTAVPNGWSLQGGTGGGSLTVTAFPSATDHSARLEITETGTRERACKSVPRVQGATFTGTATMLLSGASGSAATAFALRSGGKELAALRFGGRGQLAYLSGAGVIDSSVNYLFRTWYRIVITAHLDAHDYDLRVVDAQSGRTVLQAVRIPLAVPSATTISGVCFATPAGPAGLSLYAAQVSLTRP